MHQLNYSNEEFVSVFIIIASITHLITVPSFPSPGCSRDSWAGVVPYPALDETKASTPFSPEQAEATFEYFGEYSCFVLILLNV